MHKKLTTLILSILFIQAVRAQDANYWSSSYNPGGYLTPGAVIAFNRDSGVMFLNPALLAYNTKNSASISGNIYQYGKIKINNGVGSRLDLKSTSASIIPQMISATMAFKGKHPFTVCYALTHDPVMSYQATQQRDGKFNVLDDSYSPGDESFLGQYKRLNSINETSGLLSGGFKISDHFAMGITAQGQLRKQNMNYDVSARALINNTGGVLPPITNAEESYLATYYNLGIRFKWGLAYDKGPNHLGLTISSPLLHIAGSANLLSDNLLSELRTPGTTEVSNFLANSRQNGIKAKYKMPLSVAFGYALDYDKGQLYFATEYFAKVNEYNIFTPKAQTLIRGDIDDPELTSSILRLKDARKSVMNFGIGTSYLLKPDVTGFLSLHTNFNYADNSLYKDDEGYLSNVASYNIYHCQVGANIKKRKFNLRAGLLLSYGRTAKYSQDINFDTANESNYLMGEMFKTKASTFSAGLMLSYIHNL